jgi:hypothetical protein
MTEMREQTVKPLFYLQWPQDFPAAGYKDVLACTTKYRLPETTRLAHC